MLIRLQAINLNENRLKWKLSTSTIQCCLWMHIHSSPWLTAAKDSHFGATMMAERAGNVQLSRHSAASQASSMLFSKGWAWCNIWCMLRPQALLWVLLAWTIEFPWHNGLKKPYEAMTKANNTPDQPVASPPNQSWQWWTCQWPLQQTA